MNLSNHFTLEEMTRSQTASRMGIDNTPGPLEIKNLTTLCRKILEPIENEIGQVSVSSGYRSEKVNQAVGGVVSSQHCRGEAADITVRGLSVPELFQKIKNSSIPFHQLIEEFGGWVHVSCAPVGVTPDRECLIARKENSKTVYIKG